MTESEIPAAQVELLKAAVISNTELVESKLNEIIDFVKSIPGSYEEYEILPMQASTSYTGICASKTQLVVGGTSANFAGDCLQLVFAVTLFVPGVTVAFPRKLKTP